jgi:DNA topoisomerase-3
MFGNVDLSRKSPAWNDAKITEHHALIPTAKAPQSGALSEKERKIYELVCSRYVLQFLPDYEYEETVVEFEAGGEVFRTTGRTVINLGWQGWDIKDEREKEASQEQNGDERGEASILPAVREGETGMVQASAIEKKTTPPKPYTYHSLLAAMNGIHASVNDPQIRAKLKELQGIGTEATQEGVISTLFERGYVEKRKKQIVSTELGRLLVDLLKDGKGSVLVTPDMTALWEQRMDEIQGGASLESFVAEVVDMAREIVSGSLNIPPDIPGLERKKETARVIIEAPCPLDCGNNARRFEGKFGLFWKCECSPDITFKDVNGSPVVREARIEVACPAQGCKGSAVRFTSKKDGRPFWKCAKCGQFFDDVDGKPAVCGKRSGESK